MRCCPHRSTIIMLSGRSVKRTTALNSPLWWRKSFQLQNSKGLESRIHQLLYILLHLPSLVRTDVRIANRKPRNTAVLESSVIWNHSEAVTYEMFLSWAWTQECFCSHLFSPRMKVAQRLMCALLSRLAIENSSIIFAYWQSLQMNSLINWISRINIVFSFNSKAVTEAERIVLNWTHLQMWKTTGSVHCAWNMVMTVLMWVSAPFPFL